MDFPIAKVSWKLTLAEIEYISYLECGCNKNGSFSSECNANGECDCKPVFQGAKCNDCLPGFSGENCELCSIGFFGYPYCKGIQLFLKYHEFQLWVKI